MLYAKYINNNNDKCNICMENDINNKMIMLKCNSKHIFCYECIHDWYKQILNFTKTLCNNYKIKTMCPICRKNGGKIPMNNKFIYNKLIHYTQPFKEYCEEISKNGNPCKNYKLNNSKYCNIHKKIINNINVTICGHILKDGINTCRRKCKEDKCYLHKSKINNLEINNLEINNLEINNLEINNTDIKI